MRVPVKLLGFVFWLFSFNFAQCQDCLREDIPHENIELVEKPSYKHGEMVKVNCMTGFTGMYRLQCEQGQWKTILAQQCKKKKCSYPGDTPNGEFKLLDGSEFVFGATVVYTCNKGFEMTSRINQRTCRSEGWDNTLPVCEVVKCPHIHTAESVTAVGNTEEGKYNDSIHFECVSSDKMLDGSSDIYCTETGEWSGSVPTCKDITCAAPHIPHGIIDDRMKEYRKDDILQYRCSEGFKRREGNPRCSRFGWTPNPECNEIMCVANLTVNMRSDGLPGPVSIRPGETTTLSCVGTGSELRGYSKISCLRSGEWNVQFPKCVRGKCQKPPSVNYADTVDSTGPVKNEYDPGERVEYVCFRKYTLDQRPPYSRYLTCEEGEWRGNIKCLKPCTVTVEEMDKRGIELQWGGRRKIFSPHEDRITFACQWGKYLKVHDLRQTCNDGVLILPECE